MIAPAAKREPVTAYIGLGSNMDPEANLLRALELLGSALAISGVSSVFRTEAIAPTPQPAFLNTVWRVETTLGARALKLDLLRSIEETMGRVRTEDPCEPRPIDLDLLLFGREVLDEDGLRLPDPDIRTRPFLAMGLVEISPLMTFPDTGETIRSYTVGKIRIARRVTQTLKARFAKIPRTEI